MNVRLLYVMLLFLITPTLVVAHELHGKVVNSENKPIQDVQVSVLNSNNHTHTDKNGEFELDGVEVGDTILLTHVSHELQIIPITNVEEVLMITMTESIFQLDDIVVNPDVKILNVITQIDLNIAPVKSSQEVLKRVPGLFIGQHAGGGKAEQIFLRGFDIDHGTDVSIAVDGLPVNMVSHAHGQGYADLHFIIPETIDKIDFGKGPYYADKGNFTTAGYVQFETKEKLDKSSIRLERGQFNHLRTVGLFDILDSDHQSAYVAAEYVRMDGFVESPQNFSRFNLFGKYSTHVNDHDELSILASYFTSQWDASGQIPQRAVDQGLITRFGAIDDTEGGSTGRKNIKVDYTKFISHHSSVKNSVFFSQYDFELYSNFTFFLENPIDGDQIKQKENRNIIGALSELNHTFSEKDHLLRLGVGIRNDQANDTELSWTKNRRTTLETVQLGDINETNLFAYANVEFSLGKWLVNPSLRFDYFDFQYNDHMLPAYETQAAQKALVSPKLNFLYNHSRQIQGYLKLGTGYHSNDTRVVVAQNGKEILPVAYGADLGGVWKPLPRLFINAAAWYLFLEQEFVYVGDAGIVEPSGQSQRVGIDFGVRYQLNDWLFAYADINTAVAESVDEPANASYIPLAPNMTSSGGLSVNHKSGFSSSLTYRFLQDRPATEDYSITAEGYTIIDFNANYSFNGITLGFSIENLLNSEWNETQFATESRLMNEMESVEEIHFTPGTPFFLRGTVIYEF